MGGNSDSWEKSKGRRLDPRNSGMNNKKKKKVKK